MRDNREQPSSSSRVVRRGRSCGRRRSGSAYWQHQYSRLASSSSAQSCRLGALTNSATADSAARRECWASRSNGDEAGAGQEDEAESSDRYARLRAKRINGGQDEAVKPSEVDFDDEGDDDAPLTRVEVGPAWDDSEDEEDGLGHVEYEGHHGRPPMRHRASSGRRRPIPGGAGERSYLSSLWPSPSRLRQWLVRLTKSPSSQASLSIPNVAANLFSASLNPAVLLSMPAYFDRTGIALGLTGLIVVATLAGAGGGLWVVLGRYVGGNNIEAITGASCGRNTRWKSNIGRALAGILLACYGTGTAVIAYFALADLLLQVFFYYSPRGIPLHDRLFVTMVIGGLVTTPLVIYPLAKRNLIRFSTVLATVFYPAILSILLYYIYHEEQTSTPREPASAPRLNPLHPPSIWAPYSLLPLLSLSSSPLQIIAHNRSLRRTGISGSNVNAFMAAQAAQTFTAVGLAVAFGIGVGTQGMSRRLGLELHPNLFATLPLSDNLNLARVLFIAILSSHLALCLVTVRSAWARLFNLFHLNPFRRKGRKQAAFASNESNSSGANATDASLRDVESADNTRSSIVPVPIQRRVRKWTRPARNALAGLLLWSLTAFTAYWSGVGGFHRRKGDQRGSHPNDEAVESNFTRSEEVLGLIGAGVGFVLPAIVWIILFHIRQPRAILPPFAADMARQASAWFLGPQSVLALRKRLGVGGGGNANSAAEREPLLDDSERDNDGLPTSADYRASLEAGPHSDGGNPARVMPTWRNETHEDEVPATSGHGRTLHRTASMQSGATSHSHAATDEATRILLARKERQLQSRTRGRRRYQDLIVIAGILPLGVSLIVLGALDLRHGGW